ncbi:hypothetical protein GGF46_003462 [Coemansia sp. RSA 552]|nr:hypothetical protein GGF46_003462 [Coemansia sp. RSA 552]
MAEYSTFRRTAWDPILIVSQIVTLQCFGYGTFSFLMILAAILTDVQLSPQLLFDSTLVRGDTVEGWVIGCGLVSMGAANILPLVYMVERSRLCVDFSLTFFAVHLILVWWNQAAPPTGLLWWLVVGGSGCLMALGGRAACLRRELLPIAIRRFMPDRSPESHDDSYGGAIGAEEHELETRNVDPGPADNVPMNDSHTEVLFDSSRSGRPARPHNDTDGWSNDDWDIDDDEDDVDDGDGDDGSGDNHVTSSSSRASPGAQVSTPTRERAATPLTPQSPMAKGSKND